MSDQQISGPVPPVEDIAIAVQPPKSGRRSIATVAALAVTAAAVGGGFWAWRAWADQGAQPSQALPGNTLAYLALDLDPPGGQKVEAFKTMRKFPSLKRQLGLDSSDDIWKSVVKEINSEGDCNLDYSKFKPWVGERIAVALVAQKHPEPVVVVQVNDVAKAKTALTTISADCPDQAFGYAVSDEWAVLARTSSVAAQVETDAGRGNLADDSDFQRLTEAAGGAGLATLSAAPEAGQALIDSTEDDPFTAFFALQFVSMGFDPVMSFTSGFGLSTVAESSTEYSSGSGIAISPEFQAENDKLMKRMRHFDELTPAEQKKLMNDQRKLFEKMDLGSYQEDISDDEGDPEFSEDDFDFPTPDLPPALRTSLENFTGLGGVARFDDGGLEISIVGDNLVGSSTDLYDGSAADDHLAGLPEDTAFAFGAGFSEGWADAFVAQLKQQFSFTEQDEADLVASFEKATGLDVPGDLQALGGDGISVVMGSGFSPEAMFEDPATTPIAVRLTGDPDKAEAALDKIRKRIGTTGPVRLISRRLGDDVVVGTNAAYLDHLAAGGDLTNTDRFREVVPNAKNATTAYFVNFDAGDWLANLAAAEGDRKDAEPLGALGMTVTKNGDQQKVLYRLSFDD